MNTSNHRNSRSDNEAINSETMETKDPAINQHQTDSSGDRYSKDYTSDSDNKSDRDEDSDPYFQKNSNIAQDLDEDLKKDNDPDRRTLDEYKADQAEPDEEE
jgi:hypothetical protein